MKTLWAATRVSIKDVEKEEKESAVRHAEREASRGEVALLQSWPWRKAWSKQSPTELRPGHLYDQAMRHKLKCVRYQNLVTCLLKLYAKAF